MAHCFFDVIDSHSEDNVFEVNVDFKTHCSRRKYPDSNLILDNLTGPIKHLRVCGYHFWDCVERVAKAAYRKGFDVLVDEDLTEFFEYRFRQPGFKTGVYPSFNPRSQIDGENFFRIFMEARKGKPWLWQKY